MALVRALEERDACAELCYLLLLLLELHPLLLDFLVGNTLDSLRECGCATILSAPRHTKLVSA